MTIPYTPGDAKPLEDQLGAVLRQMPDPSGGQAAAELESELAKAFGVPHAVAVASGTAALHAALSACRPHARSRSCCSCPAPTASLPPASDKPGSR